MGLLNVLLVLKISVLFKLVPNIVMAMEYAIMEFVYALQDMIPPHIVNYTPVTLIARRAKDPKK
jgi:hypothetical protein